MKKLIHVLCGSLLLLMLANCGKEAPKVVDCSKEFSVECEAELGQLAFKEKDVLLALPLATLGCEQGNLTACSILSLLESSKETKPLIIDDKSVKQKAPIEIKIKQDGLENISSEFCLESDLECFKLEEFFKKLFDDFVDSDTESQKKKY